MQVLPKLFPKNVESRRTKLERMLLRREAQIGSQIFGPLPKGHRREFFCLDEYTWIWHEEWIDDKHQRHAVTTRYNVRSDGILKSQNGRTYQKMSPQEVRNLCKTVKLYSRRVNGEYQRMLQSV